MLNTLSKVTEPEVKPGTDQREGLSSFLSSVLPCGWATTQGTRRSLWGLVVEVLRAKKKNCSAFNCFYQVKNQAMGELLHRHGSDPRC